jgi:type II secretory pathway pseudopilin PulG
MTGTKRSKSGGFTLVELQIALLIVAVMAVLMSGALRLSSKTYSTVSRQQDFVEQRYLLAQYLRRHLSSARFKRVNTEKYGQVTGFFGDQEQINFVAPYPAFHQDGELYWWNFRLDWDQDLDQHNLVASYFPYEDGRQRDRGGDDDADGEEDAEQEEDSSIADFDREDALLKFDKDGTLYKEDIEPSRIIVARNVADLEFEYFYRDKEGVQKWVDEWQPGNITPLVIRLRIASPSGVSRADGSPQVDEDTVYQALPEILVTPRFADQKLHAESFNRAR